MDNLPLFIVALPGIDLTPEPSPTNSDKVARESSEGWEQVGAVSQSVIDLCASMTVRRRFL